MKRIAYLTSEYPAISHTFIEREARELRRRGVTLETFSVRPPRPDGILTDEAREERDATYVLLDPPYTALLESNVKAALRHPRSYLRALREAWELKTHGLEGLWRWAAYLAEGVHLGRQLKKKRIDHLHNHFSNAAANVAMLASAYSKVPFSFTLHGMAELEWPGVGPLEDKLERSSFCACICDYNRAQAYRVVELPQWSKIHIVRCGIEMSAFPRKSGPRKPGPLRILSVARLDREKGIPGLIEAFAQAVEAGLDAELVLIGDGPERAHVELEVERRGLDERVKLLGRLSGEPVRQAFVDADVFAMSSLMEGLPIVIMEAMATGTPVIAPGLAGIPELVIDDETGLLYYPARWDQLGEAMVRLGQDERLRQRLADAARIKVEEQHDIRRTVVPLEALLLGEPVPTEARRRGPRAERRAA